jgi:hypothetical protein
MTSTSPWADTDSGTCPPNPSAPPAISTSDFKPRGGDLIRVGSRRWFLQTGMAGIAGLSMPQLLQLEARASQQGNPRDRKAIILFWLSGGPSHIDMWDPKPHAPQEIRGPFGVIPTKIPGVQFCEHLPLQASIADKLSILRSVDCRASNHTPITMQAGNALARRTDDGRDGAGYPSMGSVVSKFRGANVESMPPFVGLADSWAADVWGAGDMGSEYEPVKGSELAGRFAMPPGIGVDRLQNRDALRRQFDRFQRDLDATQTMARTDHYHQQAVDMVLSGRTQQAFQVDQEPDSLREAYGRDSLGEKALLARRLVESGVTFVLVSGAWGYFDHHGDDLKWGGIEKGLKPLLPRVDRVIHTLIHDLTDRGLLDSTLVMMMGEFGRAPVLTETNGRDHWTNCMSMLMAGGGVPGGQVVGSTDGRGYGIQDRPITPSDLAATVFKYFDIDLQSHWTNAQGRPIPIVTEGGQPIRELI